MNVVLPDGNTLELADGASGLDAALAIGPKLAEQAVLIKANGETQDLRAPLPDGAKIEILTTRNTADPDALWHCAGASAIHSAEEISGEAIRSVRANAAPVVWSVISSVTRVPATCTWAATMSPGDTTNAFTFTAGAGTSSYHAV